MLNCMIRKQLYIDEELDHRLKRLAARTGQSEAEHVRAALRAYLARHLPATEDDPLAAMVGIVDAPATPDDLAERHDEYLYGSEG